MALLSVSKSEQAGTWQVQAVGPASLGAAQIPVESEVLFSSTSAVWSQSGAGHYAAANSHLDALAASRHHAGLPATAIQFGPFAETGMAASHASALTAMGLPGLKPKQVCSNAGPVGSKRGSLLHEMTRA